MKVSNKIIVIATLAVCFLYISGCSYSDKSGMSDMKPAMESSMKDTKYSMGGDMKEPAENGMKDDMGKMK